MLECHDDILDLILSHDILSSCVINPILSPDILSSRAIHLLLSRGIRWVSRTAERRRPRLRASGAGRLPRWAEGGQPQGATAVLHGRNDYIYD
jgi:hypothetical protein